jgi:hypothetical protein
MIKKDNAKKEDLRSVLPDGFRNLIDIIDNYTPMLQNIIIESKKEVKFEFTGNTNYLYKAAHDSWPWFCNESGATNCTYLVNELKETPLLFAAAQIISSFVDEGWTFDETGVIWGGDGIWVVNSVGRRVVLHVFSSYGRASFFCGGISGEVCLCQMSKGKS